jgi:hypothetical protein
MTGTSETLRQRLVVCIRNDGFTASLESGRSYKIVPDPDASVHNMLRIVDESGEDYLYPESFFFSQPPRR